VAAPVIVTTTLTGGLFLALIVGAAVRSRGMASPVGVVGSALAVSPGALGIVRGGIDPLGSVYVEGEEWSARSVNGQSLERGASVRVVATEGLTVIVEPEPSSSSQS
jgi:membrane-bound serine protease (ClpP class)